MSLLARKLEVDLHYLCSIDRAGVGHRHTNADQRVKERFHATGNTPVGVRWRRGCVSEARRRDGDIPIREGRIRQSKSERKAWLDIVSLEISVIEKRWLREVAWYDGQ